MDMEFPRDRGTKVKKSLMEILGDWGSTVKPPGMENPWGMGVNLKKKQWGLWIFCRTTH